MRHSSAIALKDHGSPDAAVPCDEDRLSLIEPSQRVLLISHCLRNSAGCRARVGTGGFDCEECDSTCQVNRLRRYALDLGYKGVCIAPGGSLAVRYIREMKPRAIVAVACRKELEEGMDHVRKMADGHAAPPIVAVPLTKDGCVDTEVNVELALSKIAIGCRSAL